MDHAAGNRARSVIGGAVAAAGRPQRALWQRLALSLGALLVGLLLLDGALALFGAVPPEPIAQVGDQANQSRKHFVADLELGWRMRPGTSYRWRTEGQEFPFRADDRGFRIDERPNAPAPPAGAPLIALVGDSFTFGSGVAFADTYGARLADALGAAVLNRAQPGFGVDQMWRAAELEVLSGPPPDLLIVGLIQDDFQRTLHAYRAAEGFSKPRFKAERGRPVPSGREDNLGPLARILDRRSRTFTLWKTIDRRLGQQWGVGHWWELNAACLDALLDATQARGVRVLVVHIATVAGWRPFPALKELVAARAAVPGAAAFAGRSGPTVAFVDLAEGWAAPPQNAYYPRDGHLNAHGHDAVATLLANVVRRHWSDWPR